MLVSPKCVWFSNKEFGIVWNILQVKIYDKLILDEYSFIDDCEQLNKNIAINNTLPNSKKNHDYENDERYKKYFRMLKMGVPKGGVQHKMVNDGLDPSILDKKEEVEQKREKEQQTRPPNPFASNKITPSMLLGIKLTKAKPVEKVVKKENKHFNPLISLDEIKSIRNRLNKINN